MQPVRVTSNEFQERYETLREVARIKPVVITEGGADAFVVLSSKEWERLRRSERRVGLTEDLPDEWIGAIEVAAVPAEFSYLDDELA